MENIEKWVEKSSGFGFGTGYGDGNGDSFGNGYGFGFGYGYGFGFGTGYGSGFGNGYGFGYGYGYGFGFGSGDGSGDNKGVLSHNDNKIFNIDGVKTHIARIKNNIGIGYILNNDMTTEKTFVVKSDDSKYFVHGKSIVDAIRSLEEKIVADLDFEELSNKFLGEYNPKNTYNLEYFYRWHGLLTGSCEQGRQNYLKNKGLELSDSCTLKEFIELARNQYGWETIGGVLSQALKIT